MIGFTGHQLDAVVVLTVDQDEIVARLLQRAQIEGRADDTEDVIRRRQEVYAEQTEPLIEVYRGAASSTRSTAWARSRRSPSGSSTPSTSYPRAESDDRWACSTAASRSRPPSRST